MAKLSAIDRRLAELRAEITARQSLIAELSSLKQQKAKPKATRPRAVAPDVEKKAG